MNSDILFYQISELQSLLTNSDAFIITDNNIYQLYPHLFTECKNLIRVEAGEELKSFDAYRKICEELLALGIKRNDQILAIGGGTVSDLVGFIAATLLRGVEWSVVPTTLLSMVDASIGGKTGINSKNGKNLIGAFHFPKHIYVLRDFLKTLSEQEYQSGLGEVIKYAFIDDRIYQTILSEGLGQHVIDLCMNKKVEIVTEDPYELGRRKVLNLGHTWGHAIEFREGMPHGIAVLCGMKALFRMLQADDEIKKLEVLLHKLSISLPEIRVSEEHLAYLLKDKKRETDKISFVLPDATILEKNVEQLHGLLKYHE